MLKRHVPSPLIDRPKMGFRIPIDQWLRHELREWAENLINPDRLRAEGFLLSEPIQQKWREHLSGAHNWDQHLWDILMFQSWLESGHTSFSSVSSNDSYGISHQPTITDTAAQYY